MTYFIYIWAMKRVLFLSFLAMLCSCDDGDLQIEAVNFDDVGIDSCNNVDDATETTFFFKTDGDEALLLTLNGGLLENTTSLDGSITSSISTTGTPQLLYRLFTDDVSESYFCDAVPPLEPTVLAENFATGGEITILTNVSSVTAGDKIYNHNITISDLSLTNDSGERLTDTSILEYGDFNTSTSNSPSLEVPFSNYGNIAISICGTPPTDNFVRLYKLLNDEFISLDAPTSLFANSPTGETPRIDSLKTTTQSQFKNTVLNVLATADMACSTSITQEMIVGDFSSIDGAIKVSTTASEPNADGIVSYTHTITLDGLSLLLKRDTDESNDVTLEEIETMTFGTLVTTDQ